MNPATHQPDRPLGLRLAPDQVPTVSWGLWEVVPRTNGFHVSRESANGQRTEALTNEVGRTRIFRKRELADKACAAANFDATATRLKAEPLLGGVAS